MASEDGKVLNKLIKLTNRFGIYQHGKYKRIDEKFGYALDDQARALLVASEFGRNDLVDIYRNFIDRAYDRGAKKMYQFFYDAKERVAADRSILASEDALGMTAWAILATEGRRGRLEEVLEFVLVGAGSWQYLRSKAYLLLGLTEEEKPVDLEREMAEGLVNKFEETGEEWRWFEKKLTYANGLLPWALWKTAGKRGDKTCEKIARLSTDFLLEVCQERGVPLPVGCKGWCENGKRISLYDQQPVDAAYMVCCLEQAYLVTRDDYYREEARKWWNWFWGNNTKRVRVVDDDFGCFDAVTEGGVNENQGAESNICFLMAYKSAERMGFSGDRGC